MKIEGLYNRDSASSWEAYADYKLNKEMNAEKGAGALAAGETVESADTKRVGDMEGCNTCKNRKYQDGSNDPGVSFKTPSHISPEQAASKVRGHEMEHVSRERGKAMREDREVISQSVTYQNSVCSECGKVYISGGTTRTVTGSKQEVSSPEPAGEASQSTGFSAKA